MTDRIYMKEDIQLLAAALLWLCNHYEHKFPRDKQVHKLVVARVNAILETYAPSTLGAEIMRRLYPIEEIERRGKSSEKEGGRGAASVGAGKLGSADGDSGE